MKHDLLIATTNEGKLKEIKTVLETLPFRLITLLDLPSPPPEPDEPGETLIENALHKAQYYGDATGMLTLSDDTGLFIDALDGWPGIQVGRVRKQDTDSFDLLLGKMKGILEEKRTAVFRCATAVYDPKTKNTFIAIGELGGRILETPVSGGENHWGYNRLFHIPELNKEYGSMTLKEKNQISHRSKALAKIKMYLQNQYGGRHIVVPLGLVIQDGKLLMNKRNDPDRPAMHDKWEFPGGGVEMGESIEENLAREIKEETGLDSAIVAPLGVNVTHEFYEKDKYRYQVYLLPYVCKVTGGALNTRDEEVLDSRWFDLDEAAATGNQLPLNQHLLQEGLSTLKHIVTDHNL